MQAALMKYNDSRKLTIQHMQKVAHSRGGECLSTEYKNLFSKITWRCDKGHIWSAIPSNVIHHSKWCPYCARNAKYTIEDARKIIEGRGLTCLSTKYKNMHSKLQLQCPKGHIWEARLHDIKDDHTGCPECSSHKSERICRKFFEIMFNVKFPKIRPDWLRSSKGSSRRFNLELDGYNQELKLAFEFQGHQHYIHSKKWHERRTLQMQKECDEEKRRLCRANNIILIEIPWKVKLEDLEKYIRDQCKINKIIPPNIETTDYRSFDIYKDMPVRKTNKEYRMEQKQRDPEGFQQKKRESDQRYLAKYRGRLKQYHRIKYWKRKGFTESEALKMVAKSVSNGGRWVGRRGQKPLAEYLNETKQIAESKGGSCLSKNYVTAKTKLEFECIEGHRWFASSHHIKAGSWCPKCYSIRRKQKAT